jgi:rhamnose utilization protein RhaD (predicted bifunctional aldolase and dehydrogenase)
MPDCLDDLVRMSAELGAPANDYAILGEGNTSVRVDIDSFWVKASGTQLATASRESFVRVRFAPILETLGPTDRGREGLGADDEAVKRLLKEATIEGGRAPSIETFLHAMCLQLEGVQFVGHTHPTAAVGLLSAHDSRELFKGCLFPDQIVVLGPALAYVPYADPGLPLANAVQKSIGTFLDQHQRTPRVILMENHGVILLGKTAQDVVNGTAMLVKVCRILHVSLAASGPRFLSPAQVQRIDQRPDELARRKGFA